MYNYAQLDDNGNVIVLSELNSIVDLPNMILLTEEEVKNVKLLSHYDNGNFTDPSNDIQFGKNSSELDAKISELETKLDNLINMLSQK